MSSVSSVQTTAESRGKGPEQVGPYAIYGEIGCGGMASVHLAQLRSASGFTRIVAIKRMHAELARSPEFVGMFFQEARLVGRIQHPNVVAALDCVALDNSAMLVMEYVHGVSLNQLMRQSAVVPPSIASAVLIGAALGLHAAHEVVDEVGQNLRIVHRDVSPQNILVGVDGVARVLDFGIAKAAECVQHTRTGEVRGKVAYMAPEQLLGSRVGREADVYSLGVIMWELMTGRRLFPGKGPGQIMMRIANGPIGSPRSVNPSIKPQLEAVVLRALARSPDVRYRSALEFAEAVEAVVSQSSQRVLGQWIATVGKDELTRRSRILAQIDRSEFGWDVHVSEDRDATSPFGISRDAAASRSVSIVRLGAPRRKARSWRFAAGTLASVAALAAAAAVRSGAAHLRPVAVDRTVQEAPAPVPVRPSPAHDDWTVPSAWIANTPTSAPKAAAEAQVSGAPPLDPSARRAPIRELARPHTPRPKGTAASAPLAAPGAAAVPGSEFSAIGGRQ
jgi:serine/threonine protein kinase